MTWVIQTFIAVGRGLRRAGDIEVSQEDIQTLRQLDVRIKELEKRLKLYTLNVRNLHCIYYMAIRNSSLHSSESGICICSICTVYILRVILSVNVFTVYTVCVKCEHIMFVRVFVCFLN